MRTTTILGFLLCLAVLAAAGDIEPVPIRSLDRPYEVTLAINKVTAFVMPGPIESTRIPPSAIKYFVVEADQGSNILYISPKKEIYDSSGQRILQMPVTLFVVTGGIPFEFAITVTNGEDYRHQVLVAESPLEAAKRKEVQALQARFEKERNSMVEGMRSFLSTIRAEKKLKVKERTVFTDGPLYVRLQAQVGSHYLLHTNVPQAAFSIQQKAIFWDTYLLTNAKKFSVMGKEVKL